MSSVIAAHWIREIENALYLGTLLYAVASKLQASTKHGSVFFNMMKNTIIAHFHEIL